MTGIVFNKGNQPLDWGWESYALRSSLCLFEGTVCLGHSVYTIIHEDTASKLNIDSRLRALLSRATEEDDRRQFEQMGIILKALRKLKHPNKNEIVSLRRTEKFINTFFELQVEEVITAFEKFGLPQLATFYFKKDKCLNLYYVNPEVGEKDEDGLLSNILSFEVEEDESPDPVVFIFYDRLAQDLIKSRALTPLAVLPDMNILEPDRLENVRERLKPQREELAPLLPLMEPDEHGKRFYAGTWNLEGLKAFAPRLKQALDATPELEWSKKMHEDLWAELHVGNMDTLELWKLLRDKGFIPDDTWKVLERKRESGIHCPTTAIMTITSDWGTDTLANLSEEETRTHKRRTLDLD